MKPFVFKKFQIFDQNSTMKVGTDGVLLGVYSGKKDFNYALDIGTGCGLIALMLAQQSTGKILAIDIDESSVFQAKENFSNSPWNDRLDANCISLQELAKTRKNIFDKIVTNPPFFFNALKPSDSKKINSKHNRFLSFEDIANGVEILLSDDGIFDIILPIELSINFESVMYNKNLFLNYEMIIFSTIKKPIRKILSFSRNQISTFKSEKLIIQDENMYFTDEYKNFTSDFYLNLC